MTGLIPERRRESIYDWEFLTIAKKATDRFRANEKTSVLVCSDVLEESAVNKPLDGAVI